jgi:hypothetical protein
MTEKIYQTIHHGDVILHLVDEPRYLKSIAKEKSHILAFGEQTGHKHVLTTEEGMVEVLEGAGGRKYLRFGANYLVHEEHPQIAIPIASPGKIWRQDAEREKDYFADGVVRKVID